MGKTICGAFALIVTVSSVLPSQSQSCPEKAPVPRTEAARWKSIAYTLERRITTVQTSADGSTTAEETEVTATDSEGRRVFASTRKANGSGNFILDDPVAGTRTVWNTENRQAKVLTFPTAVPGRESCWKIPIQEQHHVRGEAQFGMVSITCPPAERHQGPSCEAHVNAVEPPRDDSPEAEASYEDCSRAMASVIISGKISEKNEDLGVETILGHETHGCRSTIVVRGGTHIREAWWTEFGTAKRHVGLSLRSVDESPSPWGQTIRTTREATNLTFGEPGAAMFHPPDSYEIKAVVMHEVPCDQTSKPNLDAADSH
jgi:hypothetical protein